LTVGRPDEILTDGRSAVLTLPAASNEPFFMPPFETEPVRALLRSLQESCPDDPQHWPGDRLRAMGDAGVMAWNLPGSAGGLELGDVEMLDGYRLLSSACLVSTFILTQRNAACLRIQTSSNQAAQERLLPELLTGRIFATVGISHLTTSGQHLRAPAVRAVSDGDGYLLTGFVPWATGATQADILVTGGQLEDGRQLLAAIPTARDGVVVNEPVRLMALNASQTGSVQLTNVRVTADDLLHGPVEAVMQQGSGGGAGSLGTSVLATGTTEGMLRYLDVEADKRPDLAEFTQSLRVTTNQLVNDIQLAALGHHPDGLTAAEGIRRRANSLVLRTAQAWLAATKGAGYVAGHRAERAVRESMFFLVWSCPQPVLAANLREFACVAGTEQSGNRC